MNFKHSGWVYTGNSKNGQDYTYVDQRKEIMELIGITSPVAFRDLDFELAENKNGILVNGFHVKAKTVVYERSDFGYKFETTYTVVRKKNEE